MDYRVIWRRQLHPTPVLLPGKSHGRRSLVGCSPWGHWELDTTQWLHFHFSLSYIGEGNGNPLQCSCLENPRDSGAWWAAVYRVAQSRTRLKRLSSSSSIATLGAIFKGKKKATKIFSNNSNNKNRIYINPLLSTELVCKYNCFQSSCILYYKIKCNTAFIFSSYFQNVHTADEILRPFYKRVVFSI